MLFSEPSFLFLFLPAVLLLYAVAPQRWRNTVLTFASILFYATGEAPFLPFLIGSIALNYYFGIWIGAWRGKRAATWLLAVGIASDLGLLLYFKYAGAFVTEVNRLAALLHLPLSPLHLGAIVLPLGISFFTFHKISYKVDVYRGHVVAKRRPLDLALYILFFPQLIAGPIVRYNDIAAQLDWRSRTLHWAGLVRGVHLFSIGLAKKMLLANVLALPADQIFALPPAELGPAPAWLGIVCYAFQIYFDFSGYSDMAMGLAAMFGFEFPRNFNYPYAADSVTDFWRRWHISLSTWFRDYLYIPLGGNRGGSLRTYANLLLVFFLCGLWHGAAWGFIVWGLYHGALLTGERLLNVRPSPHPHPLRRLYLLVAVLVGWVFFRAATVPLALDYLRAMFGPARAAQPLYPVSLFADRHVVVCLVIAAIASTPWPARLWARSAGRAAWLEPLHAAALFAVLVLSLVAVASGSYSPFIYFRF